MSSTTPDADLEHDLDALAECVRAIMDAADVDAEARAQDVIRRGTGRYPIVILSPRVDKSPGNRYEELLEANGFVTERHVGGKALYVRPSPFLDLDEVDP